MAQIAFKMKLKDNMKNEYILRHQQIWPRLVDLLKEEGIYDYAIYLEDESLDVFAVQKQSPNFNSAHLSNHPIMKEWWAYMKDLMESNEDNSPKITVLSEVFYIS